MAGVEKRTEGWQALHWEKFQRNVFRLQKRIYRATRRGDFKRVHNLQRLLMRSWSARCLAVRQVTQDNRGKHGGCGWGSVPHSQATDAVCPAVALFDGAGRSRATGLHPQAEWRTEAARDSDHVREGTTSTGQAGS